MDQDLQSFKWALNTVIITSFKILMAHKISCCIIVRLKLFLVLLKPLLFIIIMKDDLQMALKYFCYISYEKEMWV